MVRRPCHGSRWETIRYALDSNERTFRFCLIWIVVITTPILAAVVAVHCAPLTIRSVVEALSWFPPSFR